MELNDLTALALVGRMKEVIPRFPSTATGMAVVADWLIQWCRGNSKHAPYVQADLLATTACHELSEWSGIPTLQAIYHRLFSTNEYVQAYTREHYEPPQCPTCGDKGYHRPPDSLYVRCECGAMPETADLFIELENKRLTEAPRSDISRLRSYARTMQKLNDIDRPDPVKTKGDTDA